MLNRNGNRSKHTRGLAYNIMLYPICNIVCNLLLINKKFTFIHFI